MNTAIEEKPRLGPSAGVSLEVCQGMLEACEIWALHRSRAAGLGL
jgi:hypothetical protein